MIPKRNSLISVNPLRLLKNKIMMKKIVSFLSNPKILVVTMFWLMILVVLGTLAQANIVLYEAQQRYFSSWILWFKFFPTPGGRLTLLVMFINLSCFILKPSFWSFKKIGIIRTERKVNSFTSFM